MTELTNWHYGIMAFGTNLEMEDPLPMLLILWIMQKRHFIVDTTLECLKYFSHFKYFSYSKYFIIYN